MIGLRSRLAAALLATPLLATLLLALGLAAASPRPSPGAGGGDAAPGDTVAALLRRRLAAPSDVALHSPELVRRFYARRAYAPAWSRPDAVDPRADALVAAIRRAGEDGLRPEDYRLTAMEGALRRLRPAPAGARTADPGDRATLDLLLTDAFLTYATHLARGRVDPRRLHSGWSLAPRAVDPVAALDAALAQGRVEEALAALAPPGPAYAGVRGALRRYRAVEALGGWPVLPAGPTLRPGDRGDAVALLRERLAAGTPLAPGDEPGLYDAALEAAVREFQRSHGLRDDAAVGPATRAALNLSAGARVRQLALALERLRWLPDDLGRRHLRIDIPAFELAVVEDGRTVLAMRIIGGRPDWRTPIFSARMTSVVLSPYWNIPPSIAAEEVVPAARRDPGYLSRHRIRVVTGYGAAERTVAAGSIDWSRFDPWGSRYRLRQDPGPQNPLGGVKFLFPNPYNAYLHDTPARHLFAEPVRAFSHGCMRVEQPLELAEYLLAPLGWDREAIARGIAAGVERTVDLRDPVPVHILYRTAWVDGAGRLQFRGDLYGHDRRLAAALEGDGGVVSALAAGACAPAEAGRVAGGPASGR